MTIKKKPTIEDVAELAGVSVKTVSRVINHDPNVRKNNFEKITQAIKELRYRPNQSARGMASNRSFLIGFLFPSSLNQFGWNVMLGMIEAAKQQEYRVVAMPQDLLVEDSLQEMLAEIQHSNVEGIIISPPFSGINAIRDILTKHRIPYACISPPQNYPSDNYVCTNDRQAMSYIVEHLVGLGHTRIAYISGPKYGCVVEERKSGVIDTLKRHNIAMPEELLHFGDFSFDSGQRIGKQLLEMEHRPTAIICANDLMASGVVNLAYQLGLSIPRALSITGFDDSTIAYQLYPQLTTVRQPVKDMAKMATRQLIEVLQGVNQTGRANYQFESDLIVRSSTAPYIDHN